MWNWLFPILYVLNLALLVPSFFGTVAICLTDYTPKPQRHPRRLQTQEVPINADIKQKFPELFGEKSNPHNTPIMEQTQVAKSDSTSELESSVDSLVELSSSQPKPKEPKKQPIQDKREKVAANRQPFESLDELKSLRTKLEEIGCSGSIPIKVQEIKFEEGKTRGKKTIVKTEEANLTMKVGIQNGDEKSKKKPKLPKEAEVLKDGD